MSQQESGPSQRTQPQLLTMPVFEIPWVAEFSVLISYEYTKKECKNTDRFPRLSHILLHQWCHYSLIVLKRPHKSYLEYTYFKKAALTFKTKSVLF